MAAENSQNVGLAAPAGPFQTTRNILLKTVPFLLLALGAGTVLYYVIGPAEGFMTSDSTDSLRWALATLDSGRLISSDFYYAALLPFGGNLIFLPFAALFGYSMTAQICGLVLNVLLHTAALYYLARGTGFGVNASAALTSIVLLILSSSEKLREVMWEHIFYYNLGILFFCFGFGLALRIVRDGGLLHDFRGKKVSERIRLGVLLVFSMFAATNGLQTLICFTLPVFSAIFGERFFDPAEKLTSKRNRLTWSFLAGLAVYSALGFLLMKPISHGVKAGYADAFSTYSAMSDWSGNFLGFWANWFSLLGVSVNAGDPLTGLDSVGNIFGIISGLLLLLMPVMLLFHFGKIENRAVKILLLGHFTLSACILFAVVFGYLGSANWRLTPMLATSAILSVLTAAELFRQKKAAARIGTVFAAVLILTAAVSAAEIAKLPADYGRNSLKHIAAAELEARGLRYGYAGFWQAEMITLLSDGKIQTANIKTDNNTPEEYRYQMPHNSFEDKETDRYFLLLTEPENMELEEWLDWQRDADNITEMFTIPRAQDDLVTADGQYYVYVFTQNIF